MGTTFAGRVAASLLRAIGLDELVTHSLEDYEALALNLALDPGRLDALKARLALNRDRAPLFDTPAYTRSLEAAYRTMWERQRSGQLPESFAVDAGL
jgi:predicted O-linked N-acetylglucosamine transferase (SPINDLY family)